jgi:hypothetical protein
MGKFKNSQAMYHVQHGGMEKVSLQGPEDFSGMGEGKTSNSKDIMLQHHDARPPKTVDI